MAKVINNNNNNKGEASDDDDYGWNYINGDTLNEWINNDKMKDKYKIFDMRDDDYGPIKIKGAINIPSDLFTKENQKQLYSKYKNIPNIIFHCMYSQARGPNAADNYSKLIDKNSKQKIWVLKGGIKYFGKEYPKSCSKANDPNSLGFK